MRGGLRLADAAGMSTSTTHTASRTSMMAALARGLHRARHTQPWVLDDPFALSLVGPGWEVLEATLAETYPEHLGERAIAFMAARSRYAEDRLVGGSFSQYVLLGAGLDSFAWRRPDVLGSVRVFEVDHPATQAAKRARAAELALPDSDRHVFVAVDFETEPLAAALGAAGFDWSQPALFVWLGVVCYLTQEAVEATLMAVSSAAPGSEITLSYAPPPDELDEDGRAFVARFAPQAAAGGEPLLLHWSPPEAERVVTRCGLQIADHPTPAQLEATLFAGRGDALRPHCVERMLTARVGRP